MSPRQSREAAEETEKHVTSGRKQEEKKEMKGNVQSGSFHQAQ